MHEEGKIWVIFWCLQNILFCFSLFCFSAKIPPKNLSISIIGNKKKYVAKLKIWTNREKCNYLFLEAHLCNKKSQHFCVLVLNFTITSIYSFIAFCNTANLLRTNLSNEFNLFYILFSSVYPVHGIFLNLILFVYYVLIVFLLLSKSLYFSFKGWYLLPGWA